MEDKLEEQEPGRKHLSGYYVRKGHDTMVDGQRRPLILLVGALALACPGYAVSLPAPALALHLGSAWPCACLPDCAAGCLPLSEALADACLPCLHPPCVLLFFSLSQLPQATEIIKSATNIRNTRFHIQRPNTGAGVGGGGLTPGCCQPVHSCVCRTPGEQQALARPPALLAPCDHPACPQPLPSCRSPAGCRQRRQHDAAVAV